MGRLNDAKLLGGIGSILIILSIIPGPGPFLGLAGFILVLIAVKYISDYLGDKAIFQNMLIATVLAIAIIGVVVFALIGLFFALVPSSFTQFFPQGIFSSGGVSLAFLSGIVNFFVVVIAVVLLVWVLFVLSAYFLRRSYKAIAEKLHIDWFNLASLLYLIGAILTIVLIGFIIIFVAAVIQAVAFFSIEEPSQTQSYTIPE